MARAPRAGLRPAWSLCLIGALAAPVPGRAADPDPVIDEAEVQRRLDRATVYINQDNCAAAIREFDVIDPYFRTHGDLPAFRWNYAQCLARQGRPVDAAGSYELMLGLDLPEATRAAVEEELGRLRREALGSLVLTCVPVGSTVEIEGVVDVPVPCPVEWKDFPAGTRTFRVLSPGDVRTEIRQRVAPGVKAEISVEVTPELLVRSPVPGSYVQVDGRYAGTSGPTDPLVLRDLEPGVHEVRVTSPSGGRPWVGKARLVTGERQQLAARLQGLTFAGGGGDVVEDVADANGGSDTWLWVGVGLGAAAVVGAAVGAAVLFSAPEPETALMVDLMLD